MNNQRGSSFSSLNVLLLAAWLGLVTGLAEVSVLAAKRYLPHRFTNRGIDVLWMAPLADALLLTVAGVILVLLAGRWPRLVSVRLASFVLTFLGFLSVLLMYSPLHYLARLLLASGLAVQASRVLAAHSRGLFVLVRRTTVCILAVVVGAAVAVQGWSWLTERRAVATLPPSTPAPNVLLIVLDTVRAKNLSLYSYHRPTTPRLQALGKTGVVFERALSTSPWTLPSHASMFTGRYPHELSADWLAPLDATYPTLAEILTTRGYHTAGFVANPLFCQRETGLARGFTRYEDYPISLAEFVGSSSLGQAMLNSHTLRRIVGTYQVAGRKTASEVNGDVLRWLAGQNPSRPFFVFLNYFDAHEPYVSPGRYDAMFAATPIRRYSQIQYQGRQAWRVETEKTSPKEIQAEVDAYDGAIAYLDHQLGVLLDALQENGRLENTLVIVTSDHGEEFGDHGVFGHGNGLYLPAVHVPLIISFPSRVPAGLRVHDPVTLRDLPATIVQLLGAVDVRFPGQSLSRYWEGGDAARRTPGSPLLSELNPDPRRPKWNGGTRSLVSGGMRYIKNRDGREELYDFDNDPSERHDLARTEEGRAALAALRKSLDDLLARPRTAAPAG